MKIKSKTKVSFAIRPLLVKKELHPLRYLSQRATFWIAVFSVFAFVTGNMMGRHGWQVFWKSVLGSSDDSLIVYSGTVAPVARVPDYTKWATYGGNAQQHTFAEAPVDILIPLPAYDSQTQKSGNTLYYSIGYMGAYATGAEGDGVHPGIDIRVPVGTPVQSIATGIVSKVGYDAGGFGNYIVIRHPNVPDPADTLKTVTLYSAYAHLSQEFVVEGDIVQKGQQIALSGQTGLASGPHLHFQIDRDIGTDGVKVSFHPYWPFTYEEARLAGMTFNQAIDRGLNQSRGFSNTVNPLAYIQSHQTAIIVRKPVQTAVVAMSPTALRDQRLQTRRSRRHVTTSIVAMNTPILPLTSQASSSVAPVSSSSAVSSVLPVSSSSSSSSVGPLSSVSIEHDDSFDGQGWETVTLILLDASGQSIVRPSFEGKLYMRTAYGQAEFRPATLTPSDFHDGRAQVKMLPLSHTTVVIQVQPGAYLSDPMKFRE